MHSAWRRCTGLTSFPALSLPNANSFPVTWSGCTGLNGYAFPLLNFRKMTSGGSSGLDTFKDVKLATSAWSAILIDLAANALNNSVTFNGGLSNYDTATAGAARAHLTASIGSGGRGWTIIDGGGV